MSLRVESVIWAVSPLPIVGWIGKSVYEKGTWTESEPWDEHVADSWKTVRYLKIRGGNKLNLVNYLSLQTSVYILPHKSKRLHGQGFPLYTKKIERDSSAIKNWKTAAQDGTNQIKHSLQHIEFLQSNHVKLTSQDYSLNN